VLSVGSELLRGDIVDTNAAFLARALSRLGIEVTGVEAASDVLETLSDAVRRALARAEIVVTTGGLGPTQDDLTRDAIAAVLGEQMFQDPELAAQVEARFASMRRSMPASNFRQAMLIPSAEALANPHGTAPGWYVRSNGRVIAAMPGPPGEMEPMWREQVLPRIQTLLSGALTLRSLMTFGLGESTVEHRIADVIGANPRVTVATYAKAAGVEVHITAQGKTQAEADGLAAEIEAALRHRLGRAIFGSGEDTLSSVVGSMLTERRQTVAVMESATGGEVSNLITNHPGSSDYFLGGIVAYARSLKEQQGVPAAVIDEHGLYSAQTAAAMARAARERLNADIGIGVTGIAGTEQLDGVPAGTCFIAVTMGRITETREVHRPGRRDVIKRFFAQCALDLLRRQLQGDEENQA
jgi:nicotinamide-nucleotide amidase